MESAIVVIAAGLACLALSIFIMLKAMPRNGKTSALVATELRAGAVSIGLLCLFIAGIGLLAKGFLG